MASHDRWKNPTTCMICRKAPSYHHYTRHMLLHYGFELKDFSVTKAAVGDYPVVYQLKCERSARLPVVCYFDWEEGDREVMPFQPTLWFGLRSWIGSSAQALMILNNSRGAMG